MCSIAPAPAALGFDATAFLDRRRGVAAVAPAACGMVRRVGAVAVASSAPTNKRSRDAFDGKVPTIPAPEQGQQRVQERMRAELDAIRVLHRKALLLCRGDARSGAPPPVAKDGARFSVAGPRSEAPMEDAAKRRKMFPLKQSTEPAEKKQQRPVQQRAMPPPTKRSVAKPVDMCRGAGRSGAPPAAKDGARFSVAGPRSETAMEHASKRRKMSPLKQSTEAAEKKQQRPVQQRAMAPPTKRSVAKPVDMCRGAGRSGAAPATKGDAKFSAAGLGRKQPLEAVMKTKKTSAWDSAEQPANRKEPVKQRPSVQLDELLIRAKEVQKKRLLMEIAQAREKCRQEVLEIERTALPDETIYPKDLEELGITCQYAVTRTWRQAHSDGSRLTRQAKT